MNLSGIQPTFNVVVAYDKAERYRVAELNDKVPKVFEEILDEISKRSINRQKELAFVSDHWKPDGRERGHGRAGDKGGHSQA